MNLAVQDEVLAAVDLVGLTGARNLVFGYLHEDVPPEQADWYAHAQYRGSRITVEHHTGPAAALIALARRLLTGARCQRCGGLVQLSAAGAVFYRDARMVDGSSFPERDALARQCQWRRIGKKWVQGCTAADVDG